MGLTLSYAGLKSMLQEWAEDDGAEFEAALDQIIGLGEDKLVKDLDLDIFNATRTDNFTTGSQFTSRPADMLAVKSFYYTNSASRRIYLHERSYDYCLDYWPVETELSDPKYFAELNSTQWYIAPTPMDAYGWVARGIVRPAGLSDGNTTTFLSTFAADALFNACQMQAQRFLKSDNAEITSIEKEYMGVVLPLAKQDLGRMHNKYYMGK